VHTGARGPSSGAQSLPVTHSVDESRNRPPDDVLDALEPLDPPEPLDPDDVLEPVEGPLELAAEPLELVDEPLEVLDALPELPPPPLLLPPLVPEESKGWPPLLEVVAPLEVERRLEKSSVASMGPS
jgi:hypothetical protein